MGVGEEEQESVSLFFKLHSIKSGKKKSACKSKSEQEAANEERAQGETQTAD